MDRIRVVGGVPLQGQIPISGAKNAALPLMACTLLTDQPLILENVPNLADIETMQSLLAQHGTGIDITVDARGSRSFHMKTPAISGTLAPYDIVRKMRASVLVLGPLVARAGHAEVSLPGGCAIGTRPVNLHIEGLRQLGCEIRIENGYIHAAAPKGLTGACVRFPNVSVGATENLLMAATLARGTTILENAAREPEITALANCLVAMGGEIEGIGTDRLVIKGKAALSGARFRVPPDRIETGTYAVAVAITGGDVLLSGSDIELIGAVVEHLQHAGVHVGQEKDGIRVRRTNGRVTGVDVMTAPFPGFPTDVQAQMMTLMTVADGAAMITETIFENRFMHVPELARMGANITVHGASALVRGVPKLTGAPVMATDLRASVSLVLAGLAAAGETVVNRVYHLDRGYERIEEKLAACGARIERLR